MKKKIDLFKRNLIEVEYRLSKGLLDIYTIDDNIVINIVNRGSIPISPSILYTILDPKNSNIVHYLKTISDVKNLSKSYIKIDKSEDMTFISLVYPKQISNIFDITKNVIIESYADNYTHTILCITNDKGLLYVDTSIYELLYVMKEYKEELCRSNSDIDNININVTYFNEIKETSARDMFLSIFEDYEKNENYESLSLKDLFK